MVSARKLATIVARNGAKVQLSDAVAYGVRGHPVGQVPLAEQARCHEGKVAVVMST